jgi:hypothetical protein
MPHIEEGYYEFLVRWNPDQSIRGAHLIQREIRVGDDGARSFLDGDKIQSLEAGAFAGSPLAPVLSKLAHDGAATATAALAARDVMRKERDEALGQYSALKADHDELKKTAGDLQQRLTAVLADARMRDPLAEAKA